jgi:hypothetical protein
MTVTVAVNGETIHTVTVVNRGPLHPWEDDDGPGGNGMRVYEWSTGEVTGTIHHRRHRGAVALAERVLAAVADACPTVRAP